IAADNLLNRAVPGGEASRGEPWIEAAYGDFNCDARQEICLSNDRLVALLSPHKGGQLYELDVRSIAHNLLATLARRPEAYHRKVQAGAGGKSDVAAVSDQIIFKQAGLDSHLQYDSHLRKSLLDHFYDADVSLHSVLRGEA